LEIKPKFTGTSLNASEGPLVEFKCVIQLLLPQVIGSEDRKRSEKALQKGGSENGAKIWLAGG